ncbi:hypothetical protein [Polymorphobacter sp.]|uniref:hypothetical protein n=1 Tax=Polymorphobacter sp. TaxID=1909290 RepID=UPI003F70B43C
MIEAPPAGLSGGRVFLVFKALVYGLLLFDAGLLYVFGTWREVVEQSGWLMILAAFEWESRGLAMAVVGGPWRRRAPRGLETLGYALAGFSWAAYGFEAEWLNFANASLWLLVAAAIAYDLHWSGRYGTTAWRLRSLGKGALYLGIIVIALTWGFQGEWLDFWDAMLWVMCFFVIELKIFDFEARRVSRSAVPTA